MGQEFTSKNTSINSTKLPSIYHNRYFTRYVQSIIDNKGTCCIIDYGCGKYTDHIAMDLYTKYHGLAAIKFYDKYNQPASVNKDTFYYMTLADVIVVSNVLNVIKEEETMRSLIHDVSESIARSHGFAYFTIYEGNKSGFGRQTKDDCWQRNEKAENYIPLLNEYFNYVVRHGNVLICSMI